MNNEPKCKDLVGPAWKNRYAQLLQYVDNPEFIPHGNGKEDGPEEEYICPLFHVFLEGKDVGYWPMSENMDTDFFQLTFSYGGPSEEIRIFPNDTAEFRYHDWADGAGIPIEDKRIIRLLVWGFLRCSSLSQMFAHYRRKDQMNAVQHGESFCIHTYVHNGTVWVNAEPIEREEYEELNTGYGSPVKRYPRKGGYAYYKFTPLEHTRETV